MKTQDFATRTEMREQENVSRDGYFPIGIDIGYSGTKVICPNKIFAFPSFAIRAREQLLGVVTEDNENDIYYRSSDAPDEVWAVGRAAEKRVSDKDTTSASERLFTRSRYDSSVYQIVVSTALGLAMMPNAFGSSEGKKIVVQTGLPAQYLGDTKDIVAAFAGTRKFDLKIGPASEWKHYEITLGQNDVQVMSQPVGTILSVAIDDAGNPVPDLQDVYVKRTLVVDPGFLTMDTVSLANGGIAGMETFDDLGMHEVLRRTCEEIRKQYGVEVRVSTMQPHLESGSITVYDRKAHKGQNVDFGNILEEKCAEVARDAVKRIDDTYDYMDGYDYLIVTGGTGDAWYQALYSTYKDVPEIHILRGNENSTLPMIYSNVRGYYLGLVGSLE